MMLFEEKIDIALNRFMLSSIVGLVAMMVFIEVIR